MNLFSFICKEHIATGTVRRFWTEDRSQTPPPPQCVAVAGKTFFKEEGTLSRRRRSMKAWNEYRTRVIGQTQHEPVWHGHEGVTSVFCWGGGLHSSLTADWKPSELSWSSCFSHISCQSNADTPLPLTAAIQQVTTRLFQSVAVTMWVMAVRPPSALWPLRAPLQVQPICRVTRHPLSVWNSHTFQRLFTRPPNWDTIPHHYWVRLLVSNVFFTV